jgi:hypothetical protein
VIWRSAVVTAYAAWALLCSFVFGGGWTVFGLFAVWGGVWLLFSLFWRWAEDTRRALWRKHGYY